MITGEIKGTVDRVRNAFTEGRQEPRRQGGERVPRRPTPRRADKTVTAVGRDAVGV
ncbi:hypothetical protein [Streptomyces sp. NPDC058307]|uniref:hypothetical protein n=1 Tax=Streptomyces sp. NPDC058307 TaxID=3346439 RepID=UPI0036E05860